MLYIVIEGSERPAGEDTSIHYLEHFRHITATYGKLVGNPTPGPTDDALVDGKLGLFVFLPLRREDTPRVYNKDGPTLEAKLHDGTGKGLQRWQRNREEGVIFLGATIWLVSISLSSC